MDFRIEANGVTPIPAPTSTDTSNLNTSSDAEPNGPSTCALSGPLDVDLGRGNTPSREVGHD